MAACPMIKQSLCLAGDYSMTDRSDVLAYT